MASSGHRHLLADATDLVAEVDGIINTLRSRLAGVDEFKAGFVSLDYNETYKGTLHYIFDRFNNFVWAKSKPLLPAERVDTKSSGSFKPSRSAGIVDGSAL